jgi:penicillin-binding protein 2
MHCWNRAGHGYQSVIPAIARSCDVYFYRGGLSIKDKDPANVIAHYAREFSYGAPTGIDLYGESKGRVPDMEWWVETKKANGFSGSDLLWYDGNTCNYMIGQGDVVATPLQVMQSAAIVAWQGKSYTPHLLLGHGANNKVVRERKQAEQSTKLDPDALAIVSQGMRAAVTMGTCKQLDSLGLSICAKTGTAENKGNDHAWVCGYYPAGAPRYAFVCLVEHGGHGAEAAIPPMKQVLQYMHKYEPIKSP